MIATIGLTFRKGCIEVNVHDVHKGVVYWGRYFGDEKLPSGMFRNSVAEFEKMTEKAIADGAEVFTMVRP